MCDGVWQEVSVVSCIHAYRTMHWLHVWRNKDAFVVELVDE